MKRTTLINFKHECINSLKVRSPEERRSIRVAERLALPTSVHGVAGSNPAGGEIFPEPKRRFTAQSLSCSSFHRLKMTEILLKGHKTLTQPSNKRSADKTPYSNSDLYRILSCIYIYRKVNLIIISVWNYCASHKRWQCFTAIQDQHIVENRRRR